MKKKDGKRINRYELELVLNYQYSQMNDTDWLMKDANPVNVFISLDIPFIHGQI